MRIAFLSQKSMHNRLVRNWIKMRSRSSLYRDDLLTILQLLIPSWYRLQFKCTYRFNLLRSLVVNFLRVLIQVHVFNFTETLDGWHCLFSRHNFWVYLIDKITFLCRKTVYNYKTHSTLEFVLNTPPPLVKYLDLNQGGYLKRFSKTRIKRHIFIIWKYDFMKIAQNQGRWVFKTNYTVIYWTFRVPLQMPIWHLMPGAEVPISAPAPGADIGTGAGAGL